MDKSRLEWKVGLFVFIGLALLAVLLLQFSKGASFFRPTYDLLLRAPTVGGLKVRAQVLMSGIQVGHVSDMQLDPGGTNVIITLRIHQRYKIFKDARFAIDQSGFLGDQYVAILPTENQGPVFAPGDEARVESPLDLQEVARSVAEFLKHIGSTATNVSEVLSNARSTFLSGKSLTNLAETIANVNLASARSVTAMSNVQALVEINSNAITHAANNLLVFSQQATQVASAARELLTTNSPAINSTVAAIEASAANIHASSITLSNLIEGVQEGRGLAGKLLVDDTLANEISQIANNLTIATSNLSVTTSNLNRRGLWGILWRQKPPRTNAPVPGRGSLTSPKNPYS
ncbi:MAG TPA: MlaD family protein [Candidatus Paceibacterota bacterium]|nr:MlaD family protein [Verrucomicrobiota bacterium]HSA11900.1 MlaD family protein [Candidatus Paceibacterota bacterium]